MTPRALATATSASGQSTPPPLRVTYCIDNLQASGGTELNAVRLVERLDRTRVTPSLIALESDGPMRERYEAAGVPVHTFSPGGSFASHRALRSALKLARHLGSTADLVHCHDLYTNVFCGLAGRLARRPAVLTSKRWWRPAQRSLHVANAIAYHVSNRVLANSNAVRDSLRSMERVPGSRCVVVPNFLDDDAFAPIEDGHVVRLRNRFGVPEGVPVVGIVARLREGKNHALLLRAVAILGDGLAPHVVIIGEGEMLSTLTSLSTELGISDRTHFVGHVPTSDRPQAAFDVATLTSRQEGFPNAVIEAMAVSRPIVATRVGGVPDAVVHGITGLLVRPGDATELAGALHRVLSAPAEAARFGAAGRERAWNRFRTDAVLSTLYRVYDSMVAGRRPWRVERP